MAVRFRRHIVGVKNAVLGSGNVKRYGHATGQLPAARVGAGLAGALIQADARVGKADTNTAGGQLGNINNGHLL